MRLVFPCIAEEDSRYGNGVECSGNLVLRVPKGEAGLAGVTALYSCEAHIPEGYESYETTKRVAAANEKRRGRSVSWD